MSEPSDQDPVETPKTPEIPTDPHDRPHAADGVPDGAALRQTAAIPDTDLEEVQRHCVPLRIRMAQALLLLIVIAVAAGLVVHNMAVAPGRSQAGVATPTQVPLGPILLLSNVSSGTVTLNGALLGGSPPLVATFRHGLNTLTLTAPLFHPRTCHVQWPGRQHDGGCTLENNVGPPRSVGGQPVSPVLVVVLPFGLEDLPTAAQTQTLANVTAALQHLPPQTRVPAGEYIATGQDASGAIVSQRTARPLQAALLAAATTLTYTTGNSFCADPDCVPLPVDTATPTTAQHGEQPQWVVTADLYIHWQFSSSTGVVVATSASWSTPLAISLLLTYDAQQDWIVDQSGTAQLAGFGLPLALTQTVCNFDIAMLSGVAQQHGDTLLTPQPKNRLEGCELALQTAQGANAGHFVWRFGVLLAADGPAHTLLPSLPLAPASELAAVGG